MVDLYAELASLIAALDAESIEYALCGALALAIHGVPRATKDIDVMAAASDIDRIREAVKKCGFKHEALPMTFAQSNIEVRRFTKILEGRPLMLDVLVVNETLEPVWNDRLRLQWSEGTITVVSRDGLIRLKLTAGRPQDLADVQRLEEIER
jgi:hypothetical protein